MKKIVLAGVLFILFRPGSYALDIHAGFLLGLRTMNSPDIKKTYGNGTVYCPYLSVSFWKGLAVGAAYEGGYAKKGRIGLYYEPTTLKITGYEFFISSELSQKAFVPFLKIGLASFSYKQTINSPYVSDYKVDYKKITMSLGGGIKLYLKKYFFLAGEIKYIPLKVKPYDDVVDLGGVRYLAGLGITI